MGFATVENATLETESSGFERLGKGSDDAVSIRTAEYAITIRRYADRFSPSGGSALFVPGPLPSPSLVAFEPELTSWLKASLDQPVYHGRPGQRAKLPALCWTLIWSDLPTILSGTGGLDTWRVQFDAISADPAGAGLLMARLAEALDGYMGPMGSATVRNATLETESSGFERLGKGSDDAVSIRTAEYEITFSRFSTG
jgi:hypothetical protein